MIDFVIIKSEFLLLKPGIIYGIGVVDLIKLTFQKHYWEIYIWTVILFLVFIVQWNNLYNVIDQIGELKLSFTLIMITLLEFTRVATYWFPQKKLRQNRIS